MVIGIIALLALAAIWVVGIHSATGYPPITAADRVNPQFSNSDYQNAALELIHPKLGMRSATTDADVEKMKADADAMRPWVASFDDVRMRDALNNWLAFYTRNAEEERDRFRDTGKHVDRWREERDREEDRRNRLLEIVKIPAIPKDAR